ncbi:hypothetical protein GCM10028796_10530 [Ramlibacter monticola]|uniref:FHA domain-containing protein n=1 Tax=Ramlibacter monticola TaxID=1926872 RepID=A0A936YXI1_9BURK|nr:type VI secretion system-associated FHA domain protein [Ramlibacter monticola]MBL0389906.1 FHA domain-containing protein [Ramlibacter monticola]
MALQVHVAGPGFELTRRLEPGDPPLIVGRDVDCAICLPDPERNVSRRHLSVWNEGDQLQFHVLSVVNGVQTSAGELPPGARGVLATGEVLALSSFRIAAFAAAAGEPAPPEFMDTWARLQVDAERLGPAEATAPLTPQEHEEDPFSEWGFHSGFGPATLEGEAALPATDLRPFLAGLGLDASAAAGLSRGDLEAIGRVTRIALLGLLQASEAADATRRATHAGEPATAPARELDPLRGKISLESRLRYLFGGSAASAGLVPPERAVAQLATELAAHEQAMGQAVPDALRGVLAEFEPEALKKRLLGGGGRLFESTRAWEAFARDYAERSAAGPTWVRELLARHFARAYARALLRAKRNTGQVSDG